MTIHEMITNFKERAENNPKIQAIVAELKAKAEAERKTNVETQTKSIDSTEL